MDKQTACQASHEFFQNRACKYYPCHPGADPDVFNCLFCYCPLYLLEDCEGDFVMLGPIKDCTNCLKPHHPGGYERTVSRLKAEAARRRKEWKDKE